MGRRVWLIRPLPAVAIIATALAVWPRRTGESDVNLREVSAVSRVRRIHTSETQYYSQYGHYAVTLPELAPMLDDDSLAGGAQDGYGFIVTGTGDTYQVIASPHISGGRSFYSDQSMIVRVSDGRSPVTAACPEFK
jgi:hypothetical protein